MHYYTLVVFECHNFMHQEVSFFKKSIVSCNDEVIVINKYMALTLILSNTCYFVLLIMPPLSIKHHSCLSIGIYVYINSSVHTCKLVLIAWMLKTKAISVQYENKSNCQLIVHVNCSKFVCIDPHSEKNPTKHQ